jgi:hypothetical protein
VSRGRFDAVMMDEQDDGDEEEGGDRGECSGVGFALDHGA